ncbi:MAG: DCC1-like thiol-disulfide oxidoreductase family protein [Proteobacteria bacterium]|nr:DCC1-like thiol-disulfide oxidoreductase family protein [Pseudomonadota bacterium]
MHKQTKPILLFNDECSVCTHIANWVKKSASSKSGEADIIVQPIGDSPEALRQLNPNLDIWDAYATIHMLMPDGTMKVGGEAVASVFERLPNTKWFAGSFSVHIFGFKPFQMILNVGYAILSDVRPLLGCESCGTPNLWMKPFIGLTEWARTLLGWRSRQISAPHFTPTKSLVRL